MKLANLHQASSWFEILQTTEKCQTAVMTLPAGKASGDTAEAHEHSEQVLLVVHGELEAEVGGEIFQMGEGDMVIVPAGTKHRFVNRGEWPAVTFNVYTPPEYAPGEQG